MAETRRTSARERDRRALQDDFIARIVDRYPRSLAITRVTRADREAFTTDRGGLTRATAVELGILAANDAWRLPQGWARAVLGMPIPVVALEAAKRGRTEYADTLKYTPPPGGEHHKFCRLHRLETGACTCP